jgi:putative copper export protein
MIGAVTLRWLLIPRAARLAGDSGPDPSTLGPAALYGFGASVLLWPALALVFARQLVGFRDPFVPWVEDARLLLTATTWGHVFAVACVLACAAPVLFRMAWCGRRGAWPTATAAALAMGAFPALTGHANGGAGALRGLTLVADTAHVWAAGGWIGGLGGVLALDVWARRTRGTRGLELARSVPAFSPVAVTCVAVLVATGFFASWVHVPDLRSPLSGSYGRALGAKLLVVAGVLSLGWINWRRMKPRAGTPGGAAALRRSAMIELVAAQIVLILTALLVQTPPGS